MEREWETITHFEHMRLFGGFLAGGNVPLRPVAPLPLSRLDR